jgi:hypothetical protein
MVRLKYSSGVSKITNATYDYTDISLWSGIECEVGVICACMVCLTTIPYPAGHRAPRCLERLLILLAAHNHRPDIDILQGEVRLQTLLVHQQQVRRHK